MKVFKTLVLGLHSEMAFSPNDMYHLLVKTLNQYYTQMTNKLNLSHSDPLLNVNLEKTSLDTRPPNFGNPSIKERITECKQRVQSQWVIDPVRTEISLNVVKNTVQAFAMQQNVRGGYAHFPLNHPVILSDPAHYFQLWLSLPLVDRTLVFDQTVLQPMIQLTKQSVVNVKRNLLGSAILNPNKYCNNPLLSLSQDILQNHIDLNEATDVKLPQSLNVYSSS